jgi:hypothetical protein
MGIALVEDGNYTLGAGKLLFKKEGDDHHRYIATTPEFNFSVSTEVVNLYSADGPVAVKLREVETQRDYDASFNAHDISAENLAIFLGGLVEIVEQTGSTVTDEALAAVVVGGTYQLGVAAAFPYGKRDLSSVVIDDGDTTTYVVDEDYAIDLRRGLLTILPGGDISDGANIEANYTYGTTTFQRVSGTGVRSVRGELLFIADNNEGEQADYRFPMVVIRADGDFAIKSRTEFQALPFSLSIGTDAQGNAIITDYPLIPSS